MTAEIVPIRRPFTSAKALELIQAALADTGRFLGWTDHAIEMMGDKHRGIQDQQVLTVLREATDLEDQRGMMSMKIGFACFINSYQGAI